MQIQNFRVIEVDPNSAQLQSVEMTEYAKSIGHVPVTSLEELAPMAMFFDSMNTAVWCKPDQPVKKGDIVSGTFEFNPKESMSRGRLPGFKVEAN